MSAPQPDGLTFVPFFNSLIAVSRLRDSVVSLRISALTDCRVGDECSESLLLSLLFNSPMNGVLLSRCFSVVDSSIIFAELDPQPTVPSRSIHCVTRYGVTRNK